MTSPLKPWERASASAVPASPASTTSATTATAPALPQRPSTLAATVNQNAAAYSSPGMPGMPGMAAYPGAPYGSAYQSPYAASPYARMGAYGSAYGGLGGMYGGGYGGYGAGMYGGGGMYGMRADPNDPNSLTNRFSQSTATTFQMLEGIVGAFGGFAQMLESTYMATHSSFYAMISVAEQFGRLRETLGSLLGIFTLLRWVRTVVAKLTGRPLPADAAALTPSSFARFEGRAVPPGAPGAAEPPRASRKPLLFFLLAAFGLPYLMSKMIRGLAASQESEEQRRALTQPVAVNPATLEFCRVVHDFTPESANQGQDLAVRKGDLVAVISKEDPFGNPIDWWHCRTRDGRFGYLPSSYLETIKRGSGVQKPATAIKEAPASDSSRTNSFTSSTIDSVVPDKEPVMIGRGKGGSVLGAFQKSQFYN